jgi:KDO2-lipid IV(A) lauroyltransferase
MQVKYMRRSAWRLYNRSVAGPPLRIRIRNVLVHGLTYAVLGLARLLPERVAYRVGQGLALAAWVYLPSWRHNAEVNLRLFFHGEPLAEPQARRARSRIGRLSIIHLGWQVIEFARMGFMPKDQALAMVVEAEGMEHYARALAQGRGVIGLAMHYGNWEMSGAYLVSHGVPLCAVGKKLRDSFFTELAFPRRERFGIRNVFSDDKLNSAVLRALHENSVLGLLADQNGGSTGTFAPFAGTVASCVPGPAVLALKYGSPVLLTYCKRLAPGRLRMVVKPPLDLTGIAGHDPQTGKFTPAAVAEALSRINAAYEAVIREDPPQWLWGHARWKTRPPGGAKLY